MGKYVPSRWERRSASGSLGGEENKGVGEPKGVKMDTLMTVTDGQGEGVTEVEGGEGEGTEGGAVEDEVEGGEGEEGAGDGAGGVAAEAEGEEVGEGEDVVEEGEGTKGGDDTGVGGLIGGLIDGKAGAEEGEGATEDEGGDEEVNGADTEEGTKAEDDKEDSEGAVGAQEEVIEGESLSEGPIDEGGDGAETPEEEEGGETMRDLKKIEAG